MEEEQEQVRQATLQHRWAQIVWERSAMTVPATWVGDSRECRLGSLKLFFSPSHHPLGDIQHCVCQSLWCCIWTLMEPQELFSWSQIFASVAYTDAELLLSCNISCPVRDAGDKWRLLSRCHQLSLNSTSHDSKQFVLAVMRQEVHWSLQKSFDVRVGDRAFLEKTHQVSVFVLASTDGRTTASQTTQCADDFDESSGVLLLIWACIADDSVNRTMIVSGGPLAVQEGSSPCSRASSPCRRASSVCSRALHGVEKPVVNPFPMDNPWSGGKFWRNLWGGTDLEKIFWTFIFEYWIYNIFWIIEQSTIQDYFVSLWCRPVNTWCYLFEYHPTCIWLRCFCTNGEWVVMGNFFLGNIGYGWVWILSNGVERGGSQNVAPWRALITSFFQYFTQCSK